MATTAVTAVTQEELWYPTAAQLRLPDVPAKQRAKIRAKLAPWLANLNTVEWLLDGREDSTLIGLQLPEGSAELREYQKHRRNHLAHLALESRLGIKAQDGWHVAQSLALAAKGGAVYVEGAWEHLHGKLEYTSPAPHGWVTVDGYIVDLSAEFLARRSGNTITSIEYEPLRAFSYDELKTVLADFGDWEVLTPYLWEQEGGVVPERLNEEFDEIAEQTEIWEERASFVHDTAFKPVLDKLSARLIAEGLAKPPRVVDPNMREAFDIPKHEEGTPICKLHTAFDEAGFCIHRCNCGSCENVGYTTHASADETIQMLDKVAAAIEDVPELAGDFEQINQTMLDVARDGDMGLYSPKAFTFEVRLEPKEAKA